MPGYVSITNSGWDPRFFSKDTDLCVRGWVQDTEEGIQASGIGEAREATERAGFCGGDSAV